MLPRGRKLSLGLSRPMSFHKCERFDDRGLPCPYFGLGQFVGSRVIGRGRVNDSKRRRRGRKSRDRDIDFDFDDPDDPDDAQSPLTRSQEAISPHGLRVASMVSLEQLALQGMKGIPSFDNGGLQWAMTLLNSPLIRQFFQQQQPLPSRGISAPLELGLSRFEEQLSTGQRQASKQFEEANLPNFLDGFLGNILRAVAAAGATGATAVALSRAMGNPNTGSGRFSPGSTRVSAGAGGLRVFRAPTFRPGFQRRKSGSQFDGTIGPGQEAE